VINLRIWHLNLMQWTASETVSTVTELTDHAIQPEC